MSWPFVSQGIPSPTFDSGLVAVPTTLTNVPNTGTGIKYLMGIAFRSPSGVPITVTVYDGNNMLVFKGDVYGASFAPTPPELPFEPLEAPLKWEASASGVVGHLWGW